MPHAISKHMIVKCGTYALVGASRTLDQEIFGDIARQCVESRVPVTIISSGAVKAGEESIHGGEPAFGLFRKEYAAIGARYLLQKWGDAFATYGTEISQIWMTSVNVTHSDERDSIYGAIRLCHLRGIVPIVNGNDAVSDSQHSVDNDCLAAVIAELTHPDAVLFLTRVGGVYEQDPSRNPRARRYAEIDPRTALTSPWLTNGMARKLTEAVRCFAMGMRVAIAGVEADTIRRFAAGEPVGTMIGDSVRFY
ncbi:MAG: hypothetical protein HYT41_02590 [Candidatus Sungbacteria bacterium]|nr:hypothetical protein [Candidatus Sungbacteria bacterium]